MDSMSKKKIAHGLDSDIISNLPDNITDEILVRLPIREAVRTCVLSTKWRYKWTTVPEIDISPLTDYTPQKHDKFVDFVDRLLLLHTGQIQKFSLTTPFVKNRWVYFLSNKDIKEFKLSVWSGENYVLPSFFFLARQFRTLHLYRCVIEPPSKFTGFSHLKSLDLSRCTLGNGVLECLLSRCPLLESLVLLLRNGLDHLTICAPNLKYSRLTGNISDISFENTPLLSDLTILRTEKISDQQLELFHRSGTCPLVKLLSSLPNIRKFSVMHEETTEFVACNIPDRLPFTCHHLSRLSLWVDFEYLNQILVIFCLLNSSPNLQELCISVCSEGCTAVYDLNEIKRRVGCNMDRLQVVKIYTYKKWKLDLELKLITFVLANTPMLKLLSFQGVQFPVTEILNVPRASPNVEIKYLAVIKKPPVVASNVSDPTKKEKNEEPDK